MPRVADLNAPRRPDPDRSNDRADARTEGHAVSDLTQGLALAAFFLASFAAALVGARNLGDDPLGYYESLPLPGFAPATEALGPAWAVSHVLIGLSAFLLWRRWGWKGSGGALGLWLLQLLLTAAWTPVFFGLRDIGLGLIVAIFLMIAVFATITAFHARSRLAAWLLAPYGVWVAYVTLLNGIIWWRATG
jgi:benzodiazapine receptor